MYIWTQTSATNQQWTSITSSSNGMFLAACVNGGGIYTSNNYGNTWIQTSATNQQWKYIESSSDGSFLACITSFEIYISNNYGSTWNSVFNLTYAGLNTIALSSNGSFLVAVGSFVILTSSNYGANWTNISNTDQTVYSNVWQSITASSSGQYLAATCQNNQGVYTSNNYGASGSWILTSVTAAPNWYGITSSSDGSFIAATSYTNGIYISSNYGNNWTQTTAINANWLQIVSSSNGTFLAAIVQNGYIYISNNSGVSWVQTSAPNAGWYGLTSSSNGFYLYAVIYGGGIYRGIKNTNYLVNGTDLIQIFMPLSQGTQYAIQTGYKVEGNDLNTIFEPYTGGTQIITTGYNTSGYGDLNTIFSPIYPIQRLTNLDFNSNVGYSDQFTSNDTNQYIYASCIGTDYAFPPDSYTTILMSSNYGVSWSRLFPDGNTTNTNYGWNCIASNNTGSTIIAGNTSTGTIWKSTNYGSTWTNLNVPFNNWLTLCIDSNINIYAVVGSTLYKFNSNGSTLMTTIGLQIGFGINEIISSTSGIYIYYVTNGGGAYYSSNNGVSFSQSNINGSLGWTGNLAGVTCSSNGQYVYIGGALGSTAYIFFSSDYGANFYTVFTTQNINFYSLCCDSTGNIVTAGGPSTIGGNGSIYTTNNGLLGTNSTWKLLPGSNSTSYTYWTAITCDRNTGYNITMLSAQTSSFSYLGGIWTYNSIILQ